MKKTRSELTRRRFVEAFAQTFLGVNLLAHPSQAATTKASNASAQARAKNVIYIYLRGGISHVDTFDPKPGRPEMAGVEAIETSVPGIQIGDWFPQLARQMHHISLVRSMTSTQGVHDRGNYLAHTSYFQTPTIGHPSLGSFTLKRLGSDNALLPGNILINGSPQHPGSGYMPSHLAPLPITDPAAGLQNSKLLSGVRPTDFARRTELTRTLADGFTRRTPHRVAAAYDKIREEAAALMQSKDLKAFDIEQEDERVRERYGSHTFGKGCLLARRLVENGVRFIEVEEGQNWDTHNDHVVGMKKMTPSADQTMAALLEDLHQRGMLDTTLVVMATEFGRSPQISETTAGRGHHPAAFTWWLAGGGIRGGYVYGKTEPSGERVADRPVTMPDFNATIADALGIDLQATEISPSGRPFTIAHDGKPILELRG